MKYINKYIILVILIIISSCSQKRKHNYRPYYKIGQPYVINNITYYPKKDHNYNQFGIASWYGGKDKFHNNKTANGDLYNRYSLSAAHKTLPLPSIVKITNLENNRSVIVMVNDRGPFVNNRIIDISERAAELLHMKHKGTSNVFVEYLPKQTNQLFDYLILDEIEGSFAHNKNYPDVFLAKMNEYHKTEIKEIKYPLDKNSINDEKIDDLLKKYDININDNIKYKVLVGTYKAKSNAKNIIDELSKFGSSEIRISNSKEPLYKVFFGPFNIERLRAFILYLYNTGKEDILVIKEKF